MAKRTIESGSCLNERPHDEHKFRPGIFGLGRKVLCKGIPKKVDPLVEHILRHNRYYHRHKFRLLSTNNTYMMWYCEGCPSSTRFAQMRYIYVRQTLYGRDFKSLPWEL